MDPAVLAIVIPLIFFIFIFVRSSRKASAIVKPGTFSQAGIVVDFTQRTIAVNGRSYPVTAVRGLRWTSEWNRSVAYITLTDLKAPVHSIRFNGAWNKDAAETFIARLSMALEQAGGPSFT